MVAETSTEKAGGPALLRLEDFAALKVSGEDRRDFLQGQLSQDMAAITPERASQAAWCNRQGRVLCLMTVVDWDGALFLLLPAELAQDCATGLGRYTLRAKVRIELSDEPVFGCVGSDMLFPLGARASRPRRGQDALLPSAAWACCSGPGYCAVRLPGDGRRALLLGEPPGGITIAPESSWTPERWRLADIEAEIPWLGAETSGQFLAHSLNLDLSGAVSFTKGCYVGQEIIARMKYRGTPKRRMRRVQLASDAGVKAGAKVAHPDLGKITVISAAPAGDSIETLAEVRLVPGQTLDKATE